MNRRCSRLDSPGGESRNGLPQSRPRSALQGRRQRMVQPVRNQILDSAANHEVGFDDASQRSREMVAVFGPLQVHRGPGDVTDHEFRNELTDASTALGPRIRSAAASPESRPRNRQCDAPGVSFLKTLFTAESRSRRESLRCGRVAGSWPALRGRAGRLSADPSRSGHGSMAGHWCGQWLPPQTVKSQHVVQRGFCAGQVEVRGQGCGG